MKHTTEFDFSMGQRVLIPMIETKGFVDGLMVDRDGLRYHIVYWFEGERKQDWMYEWEIKEL